MALFNKVWVANWQLWHKSPLCAVLRRLAGMTFFNSCAISLLLAIHLLVTLAKLLGPGGTRQVAADRSSCINSRSAIAPDSVRQSHYARSPCARADYPLCEPTSHSELSAILKPAHAIRIPQGAGPSKYRLLFSSSRRTENLGRKGPSTQLIAAIVEMKRRNPKFGCVASPSRSITLLVSKLTSSVGGFAASPRTLSTRAGCRSSVMAIADARTASGRSICSR